MPTWIFATSSKFENLYAYMEKMSAKPLCLRGFSQHLQNWKNCCLKRNNNIYDGFSNEFAVLGKAIYGVVYKCHTMNLFFLTLGTPT